VIANRHSNPKLIAQRLDGNAKQQYLDTCAIIVTYDENGGRWDDVAPPVQSDGWGTGVRVPTIIISPLARQGQIDYR